MTRNLVFCLEKVLVLIYYAQSITDSKVAQVFEMLHNSPITEYLNIDLFLSTKYTNFLLSLKSDYINATFFHLHKCGKTDFHNLQSVTKKRLGQALP